MTSPSIKRTLSGSGDSKPFSLSGYFQQRNGNQSMPFASPSLSLDTDALSPEAVDRVFPIRSVVGVDPSKQSMFRSDSPTGSERSAGLTVENIHGYGSENGSVRSARESLASLLSNNQQPVTGIEDGLMTTRHAYQSTKEGHMIVTGLAGVDKIQRCEDEPIQCPGAVQGFGALVVLRQDPDDDSKLTVRIASENSERIVGYSPRLLFSFSSFTRILSDEQAENLLDHIEFTRDAHDDIAQNGPEVFSLIVTGADALQIKLWCATHIAAHDPQLIICEFELEDDHFHPIAAADEDAPPPPESTLDSQPTEEELLDSTTSLSKPLRVLRHARRRRGEAAAMEVFNVLSQIQEQLAAAPDLEKFLKVLIGVVKELTGFHRVMIYQFDDAWNGKVVTELVDYRATKDLYKGLNFPASDIPKQARDLYRINKVRLLYDRDQETARLVCRSREDLEVPLDMTHAYLRAMSPIHIKYLANMAVRASMSISITAFDQLWGLISCHSYGSKGMRVAFPIRKMCRLIGETASRTIEKLSYASRLQARKLINTVPTEANPSGYIVASSDDLLKLFDADFGLLSIKDETKVLGNLQDTQEALALVEYFRIKSFTSVITSQQITTTFPDLRYPPGFKYIAGALVVPLSGAGKDFIVFFRKSQLKHVHWAGNPYDKTLKEGTEAFLEPRKSFKIWSETVQGKSKEWSDEEVETAAVLCLVYGKFIEVWRQKEAALQTSQLTKILLANASHEVRTPLNAIINYLEIALEGTLDTETRENLSRSHSASKSLVYVINDLLDLTRTEEGHHLIKDETFGLSITLREVIDFFKPDASRKGISLEVIEYPGIPQFVKGDQAKIRQAVSNLVANAISHTSSGGVKVELWLFGMIEDRCDVEITVQDTGSGMSPQKLDALFRELEQVQTDMDHTDIIASKMIEANTSSSPTQQEGKILGLGLAVVARIIRNMNGQLRLKSEEGKGSRFSIQLPLTIPEATAVSGGTSVPAIGPPRSPTTSSQDPSEVTLVRKERSKSMMKSQLPSAIHRKHSDDSIKSIASVSSFKSATSSKSQVDKMLEDFTTSPLMQTPMKEDTNPFGNSIASRISTLEDTKFPPAASSPGSSPAKDLDAALRPGQKPVTDARTSIRAVKLGAGDVVPEGFASNNDDTMSVASPPATPGEVNASAKQLTMESARRTSAAETEPLHTSQFSVLVAEDDLVNSRIIKKRLEKLGHHVHLTGNGEECATVFRDKGANFDAVLMDIQMPIMDGYASTRAIRKQESEAHESSSSPERRHPIGRIPVVAVSASLLERDRQSYIDCGFDAWILKPVDFKRLNRLMDGITDQEVRASECYQPGHWEKGGWFNH